MIMPPWLSLILILLIVGCLLVVAVIVAMARKLLRPRRMTDAKATYIMGRVTPGDLGLTFQDVAFDIRDVRTGTPLRIAGWWIGQPHACGRCAVLIHGYGDAKIGAIAWAPTFHALGWNVLATDLRAHGESGGVESTAGVFEREDVGQVLNDLRAARPDDTRHIVLFGVSLGAAVAIATAVQRTDLSGIVLESAFADYRDAVAAHGHILGMPGGWMREAAYNLAERMSGADFAAVRPIDLIPKVPCPILLIQPQDDPFVPPASQAALLKAAEQHATDHPADIIWSVPQTGHVMTLAADPERFREKLAEFLDECLMPDDQASAPGTAREPSVG